MGLSTTLLGVDPELISALEEQHVNKEETKVESGSVFFSSTNPNWYTGISIVLIVIYFGTFFGLTQLFLIVMPASISLLLAFLLTFFLYSAYTLTLAGSFSASPEEDLKQKNESYFLTYFFKYFFTTVPAIVFGVLSCIGWLQSEEIATYLEFHATSEIGLLYVIQLSIKMGGKLTFLGYSIFSLVYILPHLFTDLFLNKTAIKNTMRAVQNVEINEIMNSREYLKIEELKAQWIDNEIRQYTQKAIKEPNQVLSNTYVQMMEYYSTQNI